MLQHESVIQGLEEEKLMSDGHRDLHTVHIGLTEQRNED